MADDVLRHGVQGISDLVTMTGLINLDFADVKAVMQNAGTALMAVGEGARRRPRRRRGARGDHQPAARRVDRRRQRRAAQRLGRAGSDPGRGHRGGRDDSGRPSIPMPTSSSARSSIRASRTTCASRSSPPASRSSRGVQPHPRDAPRQPRAGCQPRARERARPSPRPRYCDPNPPRTPRERPIAPAPREPEFERPPPPQRRPNGSAAARAAEPPRGPPPPDPGDDDWDVPAFLRRPRR